MKVIDRPEGLADFSSGLLGDGAPGRTFQRHCLLCCLCILSVGAASLSAAESVTPPAKAVLTVTVVNETRGGSTAPAGTEVALQILDGEQPVDMKSAVIDDKGVCVFADLPVGATLSAQAQIQYGNMAFSSPPIVLVPSQNRFDLSLPVFEVSVDRSLIHAGTHHIILRRTGNRLAITEYLQLVNDSDKAVLSDRKDPQGKPVVMEIDLPAGFRELSFSSYFHPDAAVVTKSGFYDTMAIPPGRHPAVYSYTLAARGSTMEIAKKITMPTTEVMIFAQLDGASAAGLGPSQGKMTLKDGTAAEYYTVSIPADNIVRFQITGLPASKLAWVLWISGGVVCVGILAVVLVRGKARRISHQ
jgi:hypothetical protein